MDKKIVEKIFQKCVMFCRDETLPKILELAESFGYVQLDPDKEMKLDKPDGEGWWWFKGRTPLGEAMQIFLWVRNLGGDLIAYKTKEDFGGWMVSSYQGTWQRAIGPGQA